ncbi:MAG: protein phosphatase 2C domain-containing protein [Myxococcota bacterium]|nr:protein phosphatase 2C domain-containing protein [Myxococcota bacterium]
MSNLYTYVRAFASNRQKPRDAAAVFERDDAMVVVLADGAGGLRGGDEASRSFVAVVQSALEDPAFATQELREWIDLFHRTDAAFAANRTGETTGVVVVLWPRGLFGVSTGDSQAWIIAPGRVDELTVGQHTKGRLGSNRVTPATFERPALSGVLVMATDGLFDYAAVDVIARIVRASAIGAAAERLIELIRLRSGKLADDVALVLVGRTAEC